MFRVSGQSSKKKILTILLYSLILIYMFKKKREACTFGPQGFEGEQLSNKNEDWRLEN